MTPIEFILTYSLAGFVMFAAGYIIGHSRAESKSEQMRRWWYNRERKNER
jgi:hypothetical protein